MTAGQIEEALDGIVAGSCCTQEECLGTVGVKGVAVLLGDDIESLIPADAFKLPTSSFAHAFHGVFEAIGAVDPFSHRTSLEARAERHTAELVVAVGVVVDPAKGAVYDVALEGACNKAAVAAALPDDFSLLGNLVGDDTIRPRLRELPLALCALRGAAE